MQSTQEKHEAEIISYDENERVDDGSFGRVVGDGWSAAAPSTSGKPNLDEDDSRSAYAPYYKYDQQYKV